MKKLIAPICLMLSIASFQSVAAITQEVNNHRIFGDHFDTKEKAFSQAKTVMNEVGMYSAKDIRNNFGYKHNFRTLPSSFTILDISSRVNEIMNQDGEIHFQPVTTIKYKYKYNDS
ncbi:hypothetical protein C9I98_02825 [Photobacterium sanctipauli]|uniref:DUF3316 domain-containing protein n=1 Tax=Photobacterium sanctipauli TaxID=1342794 RepID=A0A2T3P115_9GAMM|nr:DUF3316 domain-containing protein [Photobacterium sanctipauli]PSW22215.1 hypothetical protein C9I98_02825 [Photobacterium sanctipauli]